ncbi:MAG: hypothetical protein Fur0016_10320 [Anaerolineales bacterium]
MDNHVQFIKVNLAQSQSMAMQNLSKFIQPVKTREKVVILLATVLPYIVLFYPLITFVGPVGATLVTIPVAAAGWFFGPTAGLIAGLASIGVNAGLFFLFAGSQGIALLLAGWTGNLMVVVAGYSLGLINRKLTEQARLRTTLSSLERFLSILAMAARDILDPNLTEERYFYLARHLANLFVADDAYILKWDASQRKMTLLAATSDNQTPAANIVLENDPHPPKTIYLGPNQALVFNTFSPPRFVNLFTVNEISLPAHSEFILPLMAGKYKFGVVGFVFGAAHSISYDEIILAQLASSQLALAFLTAEQDVRIKKQLRESSTLAKIERALSATEKVGLETLLQLIVDSTQELIPTAQKIVLHLVDTENQVLIPRAVAGSRNISKAKLNMRLGEGIAGQVIATGKSISIADIHADPRFIEQPAPVNNRSLIVSPIKKGQHDILGTISIESELSNAFNPDDECLLESLGVQAAIAIENASLLETTSKDLQEINALYHISRNLAATLDPDRLIRDTTNLLHEIFGYYHIQVFVADPQSGDLVVHHASGEQAAALMGQSNRIAVGTGIVGHVAEIGEPFVTNNVEAVVFFMRHPLLPDTQSELTVPIKINDKVLGVLDIQEKPPRQFSQRQMNLMMAVADQLAVALQKANLYQELQNSLRQEKEMRAQLIQSERLALVGRLLASVSHELNNPLQAIQNALFLLKADEELSDQSRQDLNIILSETERMASLIGRLRSTYRATQAEDFQEIMLNDVIEDVHALTSTYMRHRSIIFTFHPDPGLPAIPVIPDKIRQVILNLFINAIEAMQNGGNLTVHTYHLPDQAQVLITFSDTGPGINPKIFSRIFEPFVTDKEAGTGLGLTITADIVHQHRGEIYAENNPEAGALFKVWLPTRRQE